MFATQMIIAAPPAIAMLVSATAANGQPLIDMFPTGATPIALMFTRPLKNTRLPIRDHSTRLAFAV
jgi:hypothetical protein